MGIPVVVLAGSMLSNVLSSGEEPISTKENKMTLS
jgi:hypothetical protein